MRSTTGKNISCEENRRISEKKVGPELCFYCGDKIDIQKDMFIRSYNSNNITTSSHQDCLTADIKKNIIKLIEENF